MHQGLHQGTLHKRREVWHVAVYLRVYVITSLFNLSLKQVNGRKLSETLSTSHRC